MDVNQFYGFFSTTCLALVGLWWAVLDRRRDLLEDSERRRESGAVHLTFLLPGLMGLFAQVGGTTNPAVWRISYVLFAVLGAAATVLVLDTWTRTVTGKRFYDGDGLLLRRHFSDWWDGTLTNSVTAPPCPTSSATPTCTTSRCPATPARAWSGRRRTSGS
jgi:hypothetical protein